MGSDVLGSAAQLIAMLVGSIGVAIVVVGAAIAGFRYVAALASRASPFPPEGLRLALGSSLALSLEFLLAADILRTAVEPGWDEIRTTIIALRLPHD